MKEWDIILSGSVLETLAFPEKFGYNDVYEMLIAVGYNSKIKVQMRII